jgi:hypothetical protein
VWNKNPKMNATCLFFHLIDQFSRSSGNVLGLLKRLKFLSPITVVILLGYRIGYILLVDMTNAGISLSNVSP